MNDLRETVAFSMWKAEADRAAPNVGKNRTPEGFADASEQERTRWLMLAAAAMTPVLREAASAAKSSCVKCDSEGWLWGYELDDPPGDEAPRPDDTRYSCDGGGCKASSVILNLIKK